VNAIAANAPARGSSMSRHAAIPTAIDATASLMMNGSRTKP
jgi:hypothetical protein